MVDQAQDTLRPNNRLSDMQATMEQTQAFENRVLERLNAGKTCLLYTSPSPRD